jgi:hypothetical protein
MATRQFHKQPCAACGGQQILVIFKDSSQGSSYWSARLPDRSMGDAFNGRYISNASAYTCTSCGRVSFYIDNLTELLE